MRKGVSLVAGIIFLALTISATVIVYEAGLPAVQNLQSTAAVDKMKITLSELDKVVRDVASGGKGTKRTVFISSDPGTLIINGSDNTISWELETSSGAISPRTSQQFGNLIIGANLDVIVSESNFTRISPQVEAIVMENQHVKVFIRKLGSPSSPVSVNTNALLLGIQNKDTGEWFDNQAMLDVSIDNNVNSRSGQGYTQAQSTGNNLPFGKVKAFMDTTYIDYNINFILESGADFLTIEGEEV